MPPRISLFQCLRQPNTQPPPSSYTRPFTSTTQRTASTQTQRRRHQDPYAIAQAKARKAANKSRQEVLKKERAATLGDPVKGVTTDYLRSFDTAPPDTEAPILPKAAAPKDDSESGNPFDAQDEGDLDAGGNNFRNFFLNTSELRKGMKYSRYLTTPSSEGSASEEDSTPPNSADLRDEHTAAERRIIRESAQDTAEEAIRRISSLSLGSEKDKYRVNVQRCVQDFGRHNTDSTLGPRAPSLNSSKHRLEKTPRCGPDTGSSEVQIAILTAKIRTLTGFLETRGTMDKANKRNLRLLVHRRAKLLKYLQRKERGGPRWQNVVNTLGLTDGTWKGEINIVGPLGGHSTVRLARLQARGIV